MLTPERSAEIQAWASVAQAVIALVAGFLITWLIFRGTRRLMTLQLMRANYDAWLNIDTFFLAHPEHLKVVGPLVSSKGEHAGSELQQKRLVCFLLLNPFYSYFYALQHGYVLPGMREKFNRSLGLLLRDNDVYRISQDEVFVDGFSEYCQALRLTPHSSPASGTAAGS